LIALANMLINVNEWMIATAALGGNAANDTENFMYEKSMYEKFMTDTDKAPAGLDTGASTLCRQPSGSHGPAGRPVHRSAVGRCAARLLPVWAPGPDPKEAAKPFPLVMTHETPEDPRVRALPSPYRARTVVSPGVSCRRARSHAGRGPSTRARRSLWTSRARLLTAAGRSVDNPGGGWGRLRERETSLGRSTCWEGPGASCGQEKVADAVS
jgi:hypothetical protein